jgi:hypothetical protein
LLSFLTFIQLLYICVIFNLPIWTLNKMTFYYWG